VVAYLLGAPEGVLEYQKALLPIVRGTSIGALDGLFLTSGRTLFEPVDNEGKKEGYSKDRDKEIHHQANIGGDTSPQALHPGKQALPHPWRALAAVETTQILTSPGTIEDPCAQFLLVLGGWVSRSSECSQPRPRAGTWGIHEELAKRASDHRAGKRRPAGDVSVL